MLKPCHAILKAGDSLYMGDIPYQFAEPVGGGMAHARFMLRDGASYSAGKSQPVVGPARSGLINLPLWLNQQLVTGASFTQFAVDASISKAKILRAGNSAMQQTDYPQCAKFSLMHRIKAGEQYNALELCIPGVKGFGSAFNTDRNGQWNGRVSGKLPDGRTLHIYVEDAREKYPRGYRFENGSLYLTLHKNLEPQDTSKAGVKDLRAFCTGTLSSVVPPAYVDLLTNDADVKQAAVEVPVSAQASHVGEFYVSLEFWLSIGEPVEPQVPLVFLDGFESPIWSKPKPGACDLSAVEERLTDLAQGWLDSGPRGQILYGDFSEFPEGSPSYFYRVRGCGYHYFTTLERFRAFLRTGDGRAYEQARAMHNHVRDLCWRDGQCSLYKCLYPWWGGSYTGNGHWADAESLLFAWLVSGDYLSFMEWERWAKAWTEPTRSDREATVACRQCKVAYWFTGDAKWKQRADVIEQRVLATIAAGKPGEGILFHPLWTDKPLGLPTMVEGALNVVDLAAGQRLETVSSLVRFGQWPVANTRTGPGLLGECYVGLQFERIADYYRGKQFRAAHRVIYGVSKDGYSRVVIEKPDDQPSTLRIAIGQRIAGDIPFQQAKLTNPDGIGKVILPLWPPKKVLIDGVWQYPPGTIGYIDGWQCAIATVPFEGKCGRYVLEVGNANGLLLHGPVSAGFAEWQSTTEEFKDVGQDSAGNWPAGSVMIGTN